MLYISTRTIKLITISSLLISFLLTSCKTIPTAPTTLEIKTLKGHSILNSAEAKKYAIYAMMASNAYQKKDEMFPLSQLGYKSEPVSYFWSGLQYDIIEKEDSDEIIIAYRGTDSIWDNITTNFSIFSTQAELAYFDLTKIINKYKDNNKTIVLVGHSLGGGLAIGMSLREGLTAITFDPSPRKFDGGIFSKPAKRTVIYQQGEILDFLRQLDFIDNAKKIVKDEDYRSTDFKFEDGKCNDPLCKHKMYNLANEILKLAILDSDPKGVKDELDMELEKIYDIIKCKYNTIPY